MTKRILYLLFVSTMYIPASLWAQIPSGYYDSAQGLSGDPLKAALNNIIKGHTTYPYSSSNTDVWDILKAADKDPNNSNNVIGIYSRFSMDGPAEYAGGSGWNREHVWAKSRGNFGTTQGPGTDCHHIVAADISTNSARNNRNFDEATNQYIDGSGNYSGTTPSYTSSTDWIWEPPAEVKGDVARMIFYMATRYEGDSGEPDLELIDGYLDNTSQAPNHGKLSTLLAWHQADPVSDAERARNDVIYSYQNNRNPFIDHPEYVCMIYTCSGGGNNIPQFTSTAITSGTENQTYTYNITATDADAGATLTITAPTKPSWLTLSDNGNGTATLSGTPLSANVGANAVTLSVSDGTDSSPQSFTITVSAVSGGGGTISDLIISEYIEGSSNNKAIEIANFTGSDVNLSNYTLHKQTNGAGSWSGGLSLSGTLTNGSVYIVANSSASSTITSIANYTGGNSELTFNGNDPVALFKSGSLIDIIGTFNGGSGNFAQNTTLRRKDNVTSPNSSYTTSEWDTYSQDTFGGLGSHTVSGGADTQAPSNPTSLSASGTTETSTNLSWSASTDNVGVTGYDIYKDGSLEGSTASTSYSVSGLTASTSYAFTVRAKDAAGNVSGNSNTANVTTSTPPDTQAPSNPTSLSASGTTETSTNLSWTASTDNVGVTGYDIYKDGSLEGSTASTSYSVSGLTASTSYAFTVRAKDAAGNVSGNSNTANVTTSDPPSGGCSGGISSFPYSEGFESGLGAWTQDSGDDINWTRDASGTPSSSTGPSSATQGSYYMYTESSGNGTGYPNKVGIFNGPCFDLSAESAATFSFAYHMYGSSMGSMDLQASSNGGSSWTSIWSQSGNQGNSWSTASVDLGSYAGGTVQLRYVGTTSTSYRSDMAIDDLSLTTGSTPPTGSNLTLTITFDNYPEETSWTLTSGGSTVASGGTYGSQADGSTLVIPITGLADGCYDFTINDAYGDGICCSYGNGSYSLTNDDGGAVLASGGSFGSSENTNFCLTGSSSRMAKTGVKEEVTPMNTFDQLEVSLRAYPNPARDVLNIDAVGIAGDAVVKIYDLTGAQKLVSTLGESKNLNISNLKSGLYIIAVYDNKKSMIHKSKFIKE